MNDGLTRQYTREKVEIALRSIGNLKAPGPDGMPALFYKEFWEDIGERVVEEVLQVLGADLCQKTASVTGHE